MGGTLMPSGVVPARGEQELALLVRQRIAARLAEYAGEREAAGLPAEDEAARRATVGRLLAEELGAQRRLALAHGSQVADATVEERVSQAVKDALFGTGSLERLLTDTTIENICVNGCDVVWVKDAAGAWRRESPVAASDAELVELVRTLAAGTGGEERRFDRGMPRLNLQLADGSRLFAVMAVTGRVSLTIRRHRFPAASMAELVRLGVCDQQLAALLRALVRARKNIVIGGGTNVGKTTVLRAFAHEIRPQERLVTIEDTFELGLDADATAHPNVVAMQAREPNIEGKGGIDQAELVRWGLRMSPDRVIVGEIRGAEVIPMCNAMSQGNDGSLSTIHASTSRGAFTKLASYAAQAPERLSLEATNLMVASAVHFVVHLGWDAGGRRVVDSVREVIDADGAQVVSNEVYRPGPDGRAIPATPLRTETLHDLIAAGLEVEGAPSPSWGVA
ncbi:Flp pilus assembly CpaF family ATPase [Streptomyces sp. 2333.5]|uniref:CpaF family protein n=1 Tax=unclassified Streptomyces TaxID=2593676 RepID=UPI0008963D5C|nr:MULTISPECIES: ATPase, T2SS/T4P/T4SS family [unclassified Streptomyces]PJJ04186.1 Flp pilus assembly CpaF family ATPase [Streptomyces sp. 2333.5]SEE70482.1 Pilus assembly protein, ATPase of CpaF family [Streptomyces sp. 2112.2]